MNLRRVVNGAVCLGLGLALSGCFALNSQAWRDGEYGTGDRSGIALNTTGFDAESAPRACVNDLEVYRAHLQAPAATTKDLSRPVNAYVTEAGGARAAMNRVNADLNALEGALNYEETQRNALNPVSRARSDAAIEVLEDDIFLNQALAEALECKM